MQMSNPLFNMLGNAMPQNEMSQMMQQFQQFKQTLNGNPKQMVMDMLNSGKISQADLNGAQEFAQQFGHFFK